jgi:hypothetical protein
MSATGGLWMFMVHIFSLKPPFIVGIVGKNWGKTYTARGMVGYKMIIPLPVDVYGYQKKDVDVIMGI